MERICYGTKVDKRQRLLRIGEKAFGAASIFNNKKGEVDDYEKKKESLGCC